ncbi:hypothetical protein V2J09_024163, partial [Rumex salicifolius]
VVQWWSGTGENWLSHGGDLHNRRFAWKETKISPKTVSTLKLKWKFDAERDITATPAKYEGILYFSSWDGSLYAVEAATGKLVWKRNLEMLTGIKGTPGINFGVNVTVSRTTPVVATTEGVLMVGLNGPAAVVGVKMTTGELVWLTWLDRHPAGIVTMSGNYYNGSFYVGTSSREEDTSSTTTCCIFIGSFSKLDATTGNVTWQTHMLPDNLGVIGGYSGAALWGSSPPIDTTRNLVFIATGNLYSAPDSVTDCQQKESADVSPHPDRCMEPENHENSVLALDLDTGAIKWYRQLGGYDVWFYACNDPSTPNCPPGPSPDADFGEAPLLVTAVVNGTARDMAVATQKSGFAWALDRDTGDIIWSTEAGPGGQTGGGTWGSATDGRRYYTNIANSDRKNMTLSPSTAVTTGGAWVAMNASTGKVLWSTPDPNNSTASGPITVANGVVFAGSTNGEGPVYAMDAESGFILWSYKTGATVFGGASVSQGCVYIGNGYKVSYGFLTPSYTTGKTLHAFCV